MNEAKLTEIVTQQLSAGLINMVQAKVKLEGISPSDAKQQLEQEDGIYNPTLEAVSSFTDDGEDESKGKKTNIEKTSGGNVVEGK